MSGVPIAPPSDWFMVLSILLGFWTGRAVAGFDMDRVEIIVPRAFWSDGFSVDKAKMAFWHRDG